MLAIVEDVVSKVADSWSPRPCMALMAATAAQKGMDSTTVIFVESTFRRSRSRSGLLRPVRQTRKCAKLV